MDMTQAFPSDYLKGADVEDGPIVLTIGDIKKELVGRDKEEKWVVRFQDDPRGLVLNVTNNHFLIDAFGKMSQGWVGNKIELYAIQTEFAGQPKVGLRVRMPSRDIGETF